MLATLAPIPLRPTRAMTPPGRLSRHDEGRSAPLATDLAGRLFDDRARLRDFEAGSTILLHGAPASAVFRVVSGTVRCCTITESGRRHIFRFARAGDLIGLDEFDTWHFTAEAVDRVRLLAAPRETLERALLDDPALHGEMRALIARELAAREEQLVVVSAARAEERLLWFLAGFARRPDADGFTTLPMTRQDIGDHLGLTLETVSRVFSGLKRKGAIAMRGTNGFRLREAACRSAA